VSRATILIIEAIRNKRLLAFDYHGGARVVEPHTYGLDKWKREVLCAYQIEGSAQGWRNFIVAEAGGLRLEPRNFLEPRPEYQRNDGAFKEILAQL
jgi:hypothetical protein